MLHSEKDPSLAIATPSGSGGIGIIRLSFPSELETAVFEALFPDGFTPKPRYAHLHSFYGFQGEKLDDLIVLFFKGPRSYTGESVIELQAHGGPVLMKMIQKACLDRCKSLGFRLAEPGEFTKRAYLNGRMDLAQAEAVADVIGAMSESALQAAQRSLSGVFSEKVRSVDEQLKELRAYVEATLDFPEEEVDHLNRGHIFEKLDQAYEQLVDILQNAQSGKVLREGVMVAIVGSPNVGKSSLLNALAGEEVAIVTDIAGTTRDKIEHWIAIDGVPLCVVDTAGIRETDDTVEKKGIERAMAEVEKAEVVLYLKDASGHISDDAETLERILKKTRSNVSIVTVLNKIDACNHVQALIDAERQVNSSAKVLGVSVKTGDGLDALRSTLLEAVGMQTQSDGLFMARERHLKALETALGHVAQAIAFGENVTNIDLLAEELRLASESLVEILGEFVADDLLGMIFSRFCIGK